MPGGAAQTWVQSLITNGCSHESSQVEVRGETMPTVLDHVMIMLNATPARWLSLAQHTTADLLKRVPAPGEWCALDCLGHLLDTERWVFPARVKAFLAGQDFPAFDPDSQGTKPEQYGTPLHMAQDFAGLRAETLALLNTVTAADLPRRQLHAELGPVTLEEMLNEWIAHDLMHTVQAEQALMQPFIAGCGPWQSYFVKHVAAGA